MHQAAPVEPASAGSAVIIGQRRRDASGPRVDAGGRITYFDGIRAVAILSVVAVHTLASRVPAFRGGYIGVDVFFVLSGFIITKLLWRSCAGAAEQSPGRFWVGFIRRRARRLYPALSGLLVVGSLVMSVSAFRVPAISLRQLWDGAALSGLQLSAIARAGGHSDLPPFGQTWSLAVEWYFYLAWPLVLFGCARRRIRPDRLWIGLSVAAAFLYAAALPLSYTWFYFGPLSRGAQMLVGAAVAIRFAVPGRPAPRLPRPGVLSALAVGGICAYTLLGPIEWSIWYRLVGVPFVVAATGVLLLVGPWGSGIAHRVLRSAPLGLVGRSSYSLYLWHLLPMYLFDPRVLHLPLAPRIAISLSCTAALTTASYRLLEKPFLNSRSDALR